MDSDPKSPTSGNGSTEEEQILEELLGAQEILGQSEDELAESIALAGSDPADDIPPLSTPDKCSKCGSTVPNPKVCSTCKGPFCDQHQSPLDPAFCSSCLDGTVSTITVTEGLKDAEGGNHHGREIHPQGPFFSSVCKQIAEMSDIELKGHIDYYKDLVRQAERNLDFRRTVLGAAQLEDGQREDAKRRHFPKSRGGKTVNVQLPGSAKTASQKRDSNPSTLIAKALGVNGAKADAFMEMFKQMLATAPNIKKEDKK